jgi:hypothetical protein
MTTSLRLASIAFGTSLLVACGGGGGGGEGGLSIEKQTLSMAEDGVLDGQLQFRGGGSRAEYRISNPAAFGAVTLLGGGRFRYTPRADAHGADTFSIEVRSDGKTGEGVVEVSISSINDAPRIVAQAAPAELIGGTSGSVPFAVTDVDGDTPTVSITQVSGAPLHGLRFAAGQLSFSADPVSRVTDANLRVSVDDGHGGVADLPFSIAILPRSASGRLITVKGGVDQPGYHWVITGDGYTAAEYALFRADVQTVIDAVVHGERIGVYASAWNVHLLWVPSAESGVDVPHENIFKQTAWHTNYGCGGSSRLLCFDWRAVKAAATAEVPHHDQAALLANTERYAGSAGVVASATARGTWTAEMLQHEMGHSHAGLTDEYTDANADPNLDLGDDFDNLYPNASRISDPASVKWRHWFTDPANVPTAPNQAGVGVFQGSHYVPTGVYRPTWESFMRIMNKRVDPVSAEAWGIAMHRRAGAVIPAAGTLSPEVHTLPPGQTVTLRVTPLLELPLQTLRWTVDGVHQATADNLTEFSIPVPATGSTVVRVTPADMTGLIRMPLEGPHTAFLEWTLVADEPYTKAARAALPKPAAAPLTASRDMLVLDLDADGASPRLEQARVVTLAHPTRAKTPHAGGAWAWELQDVTGRALASGTLDDVSTVRAPLPRPGEAGGHEFIKVTGQPLQLRIPYQPEAVRVIIKPRTQAMQKAHASVSIDLKKMGSDPIFQP